MKLKILITIIVTAILIIASYLYLSNLGIINFEEENWFYYEARLNTTSMQNFTIYLPVPLSSDINSPIKDQPSALMNDLDVKSGNVDYEIINTTFGYAIKLSGSGSFHIIADKYFDKDSSHEDRLGYTFGDLSLQNQSRNNRMVFFNLPSSESFNLSYNIFNKRDHSIGGHLYRFSLDGSELINGWQKIDEDIYNVIAN